MDSIWGLISKYGLNVQTIISKLEILYQNNGNWFRDCCWVALKLKGMFLPNFFEMLPKVNCLTTFNTKTNHVVPKVANQCLYVHISFVLDMFLVKCCNLVNFCILLCLFLIKIICYNLSYILKLFYNFYLFFNKYWQFLKVKLHYWAQTTNKSCQFFLK